MKLLSSVFNLFLTSSAIVAINRNVEQAVVIRPGGNQTVIQPAGSTLAVNSFNGQLTVFGASGSDISAAVNDALVEAADNCGIVTIAPGSYTWESANVKMLPCETLQGAGATVMVTAGATNPFLVVQGPAPPDPPGNNTYTVGSIRGITFVGPSAPGSQGSSIGIQLGGSSAAESAQLFNLYDIHVRNFGCGINMEWAHQIAFFGGSIEGNYDGVCFANIIAGLENLSFHGTQILNNLDYGIKEDQTGVYVELNITDCSIDYNGQQRTTGGEIEITNGKLNVENSHLENTSAPLITVLQPGAPAIVDVYISGTAFNVVDPNPSRSYAGFISVRGLNDVLEIGRGVSFSSLGVRISAVADWDPVTNQNSRLMMDPYTYTVGTNPQGLLAYVGTAPNNYSYPTYDVHDNVTGMAATFTHPQ